MFNRRFPLDVPPVDRAAETGRRTGFRWMILVLTVLTYMLAGLDRANLGIVVPFVEKEFQLTNADIGMAASLFFVGSTALQIPAGLLFERFGIRFIMAMAVFFTSLATLALGSTNSGTQLSVGRALLGAAEGPINVGGLAMINRWFPPHERGTAVGIFVASIKLAPALVPPIGAALIYSFGWRTVFYWFAVPGFFLAVLWVLLGNENPRNSPHTNSAEIAYIEDEQNASGSSRRYERDWPRLDRLIRARSVTALASNRAVLASWNIWGCAFGYGLMSGLTYAIMTWVPKYLVDTKGFSLFQVGFVASAPWVGAVFGSVVGGLLSDYVFGGRRKPLMIITTGSSALTMYGLISATNDPIVLASSLALTGVLLTVGYSTFLAYPMGLVVKSKVPLAVSLVSVMGAAGAAVAPYIIGKLLDRFDWNAAFAFLSACSLGSLLLVLIIVEPQQATSSSPSR